MAVKRGLDGLRGGDTTPESEGRLGYWSLLFIGIGGMVGGGIFAVLGLAVQMAGLATPISFALAGLVALLTSYSYARLSVTFPNRAGTVAFLSRGFGTGTAVGSLNVLLWLSYIVMLSLYAYAFGSYGSSAFPEETRVMWKHILISSVVIAFTVINAVGTLAMAGAENWIVASKIVILGFFAAVGLSAGSFSEYDVPEWPVPLEVVAGGMMIFLAYEGFQLIANATEDARDPEKDVPRALYSAVVLVMVLYVAIAFVTVGNVSPETIAEARDYALAESARPFLGATGFALITVAALLSTASAINATLFGSARVVHVSSQEGEFPKPLSESAKDTPVRGIILTSALTLLIANLVDLSDISLMGSAGFLVVFAAVNFANYRLADRTASRGSISVIGGVACIVALLMLVVRTLLSNPGEIVVLMVLLGSAFLAELTYRRYGRCGPS